MSLKTTPRIYKALRTGKSHKAANIVLEKLGESTNRLASSPKPSRTMFVDYSKLFRTIKSKVGVRSVLLISLTSFAN